MVYGYISIFFHDFYKGNSFVDFLFASVEELAVQNRVCFKGKILSLRRELKRKMTELLHMKVQIIQFFH